MAKNALSPWLGLGLHFILGLGSCEPHIPVTVNAESAANETPDPEPADPAAAGRLQDCPPGTADCDRDHGNGCEATLADDPKNCGICGTDCAIPNAETGCMGGTCRIIHCSAGFCDDDGNDENGCETAEKICHPKSVKSD